MTSVAEERLGVLRVELKQWEKRFAATHDGRKATRDEIKADADIATKYKEYNRLRESPPQTSTTQQTRNEAKAALSPSASKKRKAKHDSQRSPSKRSRTHTETPRKSRFVEQFTPSSGRRTDEDKLDVTPAMTRTFVGPTPQKDGLVLGLFDMLGTEPEADTPSKSRTQDPLQEAAQNIVANTPRKNTGEDGKQVETPQTGARQRFLRTPRSHGQRYLFDQFLTPSKRRFDDDEGEEPLDRNREGKENDESGTPAFLKRDSRSSFRHDLATIDEDADNVHSPSKGMLKARNPFNFNFNFGRPTKARKLGRSLSDMIADLRKAEDDRLDEEAAIMNEMESEPLAATAPAATARKIPSIMVEDSQAPVHANAEEVEHALGPDGAGDVSAGSDAEREMQANAGRKVWKKKGQKRTTRRVIMKPRVKPSRPTEQSDNSEDSSSEDENVQETQAGDGHAADTYVEDDEKARKASKSKDKGSRDESEKGVKAKARKVSEAAHANFRKLKLRSKNGPGNAGGRRWGKR